MNRILRILLIASLLLVSGVSTAFAQNPVPYDEMAACVAKVLPAESYSTNEYLPTQETLTKIEPLAAVRKVKVGLPWINNDENAQLHIAIENGYFKAEGLDVELLPGGPGKDHIQTLGAGVVDFGIAAGGMQIPAARLSTTPIDVIAVGTLLKGAPLTYITIDKSLLDKKLTPKDLVGKTIAVQPGGDTYINIILDRAGIPRDSVKLMEGGFTPDALLVGKADFYSGWIMNQPRLIEEKGFKWNDMPFGDWAGYSEYSDVIAVRAETLKTAEGKDLVRRFLRATYRGTQFMLEHPKEAAEITSKYASEVQISPEQALWRFEHQKQLVVGKDSLGLLAMDPENWNRTVTTLGQYKLLDVPCKR